MNKINIVPTYLRAQVSENSHRLSGGKVCEGRIELKLKSFFNFDSILKNAKAGIYKDIISGAQIGNMVLPYIESRPAGIWNYGATACNLGSMQTVDRILIFESGKEATVADLEGESLFAETDEAKKALTVHMSADEYDALQPGVKGLKLLIRNFYEDRDVLFECRVDKIPVPGIDAGNYVYSDGSRTEMNVQKNEAAAFEWGNILVKGLTVKAAAGNGRSTEWNAAAEKEGCLCALKDNLCGWTKEDDVTVFFDCVNNAYPILGWYKKTDYAKEIEALAGNFRSLTFYHIDAHTGVVGNELVDSVANVKLRGSRFEALGREDGLEIDTRHIQ